jgi:hypothetical protein
MKRLVLVIAVATIAGCLGVAWYVARGAREVAAAVAVVTQEQAGTSAALQHLGARLAAAKKEQADSRSVLDGLQPPKKPAVATADPQKVTSIVAQLSEYLSGRFQAEQKDPAAQVVRLAAERARLLTSYGLLFRTLGLLPEQIEKFQNIVAKRDEQIIDLNDVLLEAVSAKKTPLELGAMSSAVTKLKAQAETEYQAGMREVLGEAEYQQLRDYDRTVAVRNMVSGFGGAAMMAGTPLTVQQAEQFTQVLAKASSSYLTGGSASTETIDWSFADPQARQILSEAQWVLFTTVGPPNGGRTSILYHNAVNQALKAEAESRRAAASKPPGG